MSVSIDSFCSACQRLEAWYWGPLITLWFNDVNGSFSRDAATIDVPSALMLRGRCPWQIYTSDNRSIIIDRVVIDQDLSQKYFDSDGNFRSRRMAAEVTVLAGEVQVKLGVDLVVVLSAKAGGIIEFLQWNKVIGTIGEIQ